MADIKIPLPTGDSIDAVGSIGGTFVVTGGGEAHELTWETRRSTAVELEILIQVVELRGLTPRVFPTLRWQIWSLGHGQVSYDLPPIHPTGWGGAGQQRRPSWAVPARGVAVRLNARRVRMLVGCSDPAANPLVAASFLPVSSAAGWRPFPTSDCGPYGGVAGRAFFPAHANEWRISQVQAVVGDLDPSALIAIVPHSQQQTNTVEAVVTAGSLFEWQPIPIGAHSWYPIFAVGEQTAVDTAGITAIYR